MSPTVSEPIWTWSNAAKEVAIQSRQSKQRRSQLSHKSVRDQTTSSCFATVHKDEARTAQVKPHIKGNLESPQE